MNRIALIAAAFVVSGPLLQGQTPIVPIWTQFIPSAAHETRLAMDHQADRLHLALTGSPADPKTHILAFGTDGAAIAPPFDELVLGTVVLPFNMIDQPLRLLAENDTIYYVEHLQRFDPDYATNVNRAGSITLDSMPVFNVLVNGWYDDLTDIHHDPFGDLVSSLTVLRSFSMAHVLLGRISIPNTDRVAASEQRIYCGRAPNITTIDRGSLTLLSPIVVPSSGTSTRTLLMLTDDLIHYASVNSNLSLDAGAVDTTGSLIWSSSLSVPQYTTLSGITLDASGRFWVAATQGGTTPMGLLFRFDPFGVLTGDYTFGRSVDDIVCSGDSVFLSGWDATDQTMVYLAAFSTDITTALGSNERGQVRIFPNPAKTGIRVDGLPPGTTRLTITDATGRAVLELNGSFTSSMCISVAEVPNGTYLLRVSGGAVVNAKLFTVEH